MLSTPTIEGAVFGDPLGEGGWAEADLAGEGEWKEEGRHEEASASLQGAAG